MKSNELDNYKKIDAYLKGQLSNEEVDEIWVEIAKNPDLLQHLEIEAGLKEIFSEDKREALIHPMKVNSPTKEYKWIWQAAAAVAILLVALLQLFRTDTPNEIEDFVLAEIDISQIETYDALRNSEQISVPDSILNLAFEALLSADTDKALSYYNEVITNHDTEPYSSKAYLNKGIILYNEGNFQESVEALNTASEKAGQNRMVAEKAYWYLANAYLKLENYDLALEAAGNTYAQNGVFRNEAFKLYRKLSYDL